MDQHLSSWNQHLILENEKFENFVFVNLDLRFLFKQMVFIWDGNHKFQTHLCGFYHSRHLLLNKLKTLAPMSLLNCSLP
jgi:hypothetical protein